MRICVVGCGAMGSVYAARLARAGHPVSVVDRWRDHVEAIARDGLHVSGPDGEFRAALTARTVPPADPVDLVVLAVKAADVPAAAAGLAPLLDAGTTVLTIQNGLGSADVVAGAVGAGRLAIGIASGFGAGLLGPGRVRHNAMRALRFGAHSSLPPERVEEVAAAWRTAGFDAAAVDDVVAMQWEKLICNVAYSAPCALTGLTVGEVRDHPELSLTSQAAATEAWETARARGVAIDVPDPVELVRDFAARMPDAEPSALLDHRARRTSEIDVINGAVPREAAKVGRTAPVNQALTALARHREAAWRSV
ncbi:2-dehydropantoate 2-reductase [Actinomadura sp. GC306]|uniref:ketopantoate reductase family protein n=1 Tax=Actinomadura sp. GC306 TaxID=2530367 RepID=UPI00104E5ECF|nr:2-dehydropantoate 2-reductase [Actinomadura sp. GC306]TDC68515.1 2-dehydropantoate 2-reductase [Actinomadura sp. GC306]